MKYNESEIQNVDRAVDSDRSICNLVAVLHKTINHPYWMTVPAHLKQAQTRRDTRMSMSHYDTQAYIFGLLERSFLFLSGTRRKCDTNLPWILKTASIN